MSASDTHSLPPDISGPSLPGGVHSMSEGDIQQLIDRVMDEKPRVPPLDVLPCANIIDTQKLDVCKNPGKRACGSCKLVSYCSKACQTAHWATHKRDCKDPIRSSDWKPGWILEGREPSFITRSSMSSAEEFATKYREKLSIGASLWGNVTAMDIVNLPNNEEDLKIDLSLAFAASGDIRNIVTTVNALGLDYSGRMNILLNDRNPCVVSRNIILLLILGTIPDEVIAADIALHFWYSVFMPMEYHLRILSMVSTLLKNNDSAGQMVVPFGLHSTLTCLVSSDVERLLRECVSPLLTLDQAQAEYDRVRDAPSRVDFRDRMYMGLKPSHRLAFLEYRRFGIILPFGAVNAHCNAPNPSLFANGVWLQTDHADPLKSWDVNNVFRAGKAHGAQPEDVYGCLYFFLSDQLRAFSRYIRQHHISFHAFNSEASALAQDISQGKFAGCGLPSTTRFDRIDVSNIMDPNYAGIQDVVCAWGPLLARTDNAALTGYFMNWVASAKKARVTDAGRSVLKGTMDLMMESNRIRPDVDPNLSVHLAVSDIDAFYDNSEAFSEFWKEHGGADVELQLRKAHKIIPHRLKCPVDVEPNALPEFTDDETWYRYTQLMDFAWSERFVELVHNKA